MGLDSSNTTFTDNPDRVEERKDHVFNNFQVDEKHWSKIGFWCVIHNEENSKIAFEALLNNYELFSNEQEEFLKQNHSFEIGRFKNKINDAVVEIIKLQEKLEKHKDTTQISQELIMLRNEIDDLEKSLIDSYKNLGKAKKDLIQNQIDEVFSDLEKITDKYSKITERYTEISKTVSNENSETLKIKPQFLTKLRDNYQSIYDQLNNRLKNLSQSGVSYFSRSHLIGYGTAIAAGWFFSVFALEKNISNKDVPFFLLTGLFGFGNSLKTDSFAISLFSHVAFVLLSLITVFLVTLFCHFLLDRYEKKQLFSQMFFSLFFNNPNQNADEDLEASEIKQLDKQISLSPNSQITSKTFFSFWLESIPFLLILGITFIVLSLGNISSLDLDRLNISLSAQAVGTAIAFGFGGLVYLYIINIIEPRLEKNRTDENSSNWFRVNIELALILIIVVAALLFLLFGIENTLYQSSTNIFSFLMFIGCILLCSFTLGYGVYYRGLSETINFIETKMEYLTIGIAYNSFPNIRLLIRADNTFRKTYIELIEKLLKLDLNKTKLAEKILAYNDNLLIQKQQRKEVKKNDRKLNHFWNDLKNFFNPASPKEDYEFNKTLSDENRIEEEFARIEERFETLLEDKEYFPELTCEIENLKGRINGHLRKLIEHKSEIRSRSEEKTIFAKKALGEISELRAKIYNWEKYMSTLFDMQFKELENFYKKHSQELTQMHDGFNLGVWFKANEIVPINSKPKAEVEYEELS